MMLDKPIGGELTNNFLKNKKSNIFRNSKNYFFLNNGRSCLKIILKNLENKIDRIFIPDYFCIDIFDKILVSKKIHINFYKIGSDFDDNLINKKIKKDDLVLIVNYFGIKDNLEKANSIKKKFNCFVVLDMVQDSISFIKNYLILRKKIQIDYIFSSFKKSFSVPNGSCLVSKDKIQNTSKISFFDTSKYDLLWSKTVKKKRNFLNFYKKRAMSKEREYLLNFKKYSNLNNSRIGTMSKSSLNIMKKIDFKKSAKHRLSNFKFFVKKLKKMQNIKIPKYKDLNKKIPTFLPIFFKQKIERDIFIKKANKENFFFPIHWKSDSKLMKKYKIKNNLYDLEASLIIDQRIHKAQIQKVLHLIEKIR